MVIHQAAMPRTRWAILIALTLTAGSMLLYPGGTVRDESSHGYSFTHNFLSDLGYIVAFNYERNVAGAVLFGSAALIGVVTLATSVAVTVRLLLSAPTARPIARLAASVGALACLGLLVVGLTPADQAWQLHRLGGMVGFRSLPIATALLAVATMRDSRFRKRATVGWAMLTLVLVGLISAAILGPQPDTEIGLVFQVIAQKIMVAAILTVLWLESGEADRVRRPGTIQPVGDATMQNFAAG